MGAIYDDLPDHEGYAIHRANVHIGACSCGWRDDFGAADDDAAVARWDTAHAAVLLERAVPVEITDDVARAQRAIAELARTRPRAAAAVLDSLEHSVTQLRALVQQRDRGLPTVAERLAALANRPAPPGIER